MFHVVNKRNSHRHHLAIFCLSFSSAFLHGCTQAKVVDTSGRPHIKLPGSRAYLATVRSFKIDEREAYARAEAERNTNPTVARDGLWFQPHPNAIVERSYLFSRPYKQNRLDLQGIYVNGDTGQVQYRTGF